MLTFFYYVLILCKFDKSVNLIQKGKGMPHESYQELRENFKRCGSGVGALPLPLPLPLHLYLRFGSIFVHK